MGRLFWKFFLFIWLVQLLGMLGTGVLFWLEHQEREARRGEGHFEARHRPPPPPELFSQHAPPAAFPPPPLPPEHEHEHRSLPPLTPVIVGLFASLLSAAALAWYIAKPIRRLRQGFEAAVAGDMQASIGEGMGRRRDELADLGRDFDRMMAHLRSLMESQQRLLHDVSHELRSPLARLHAAIGLARQQPARIADSLRRIEREGERMNRLVGELLTLSRLEAGVSGVLEEVDLGELLQALVEDARFEGMSRHVTVDAPGMPDWLVRANAELLHRAIENVLRNALRYSPDGGVVRIELRRVAPGRCRMSILDEGPGVAAAQLEAIFTPFFRGERPGDGYGLGLAIARRILAAVDGEIRARNRPQGGLAVDIELPVWPA